MAVLFEAPTILGLVRLLRARHPDAFLRMEMGLNDAGRTHTTQGSVRHWPEDPEEARELLSALESLPEAELDALLLSAPAVGDAVGGGA